MIDRGGRTTAAVALALVASSCLFTRKNDPTRFYVLTTTVAPSEAAPGPLTIGLGPIVMPGYLQRPSLATRVDSAEIRYAEYDRWAEPLPSLFARALGDDLSALLGTARIVPYPWYPVTPLDLVVRVDVNAFEPDVSGNARLEACWTVKNPRTATATRAQCGSIAEATDGGGPQSHVNVLSRMVGELARRIAVTLRS